MMVPAAAVSAWAPAWVPAPPHRPTHQPFPASLGSLGWHHTASLSWCLSTLCQCLCASEGLHTRKTTAGVQCQLLQAPTSPHTAATQAWLMNHSNSAGRCDRLPGSSHAAAPTQQQTPPPKHTHLGCYRVIALAWLDAELQGAVQLKQGDGGSNNDVAVEVGAEHVELHELHHGVKWRV